MIKEFNTSALQKIGKEARMEGRITSKKSKVRHQKTHQSSCQVLAQSVLAQLYVTGIYQPPDPCQDTYNQNIG